MQATANSREASANNRTGAYTKSSVLAEKSRTRRKTGGTKRPAPETSSSNSAPRARKASRRDSKGSRKSAPSNPTAERRRTRSQSLPRKLCRDILPHTDYGLIREPFDSSKYTPGLAAHDADNKGDVLEVSNYVTDIYQRLYNAEVRPMTQCHW